MRDDEVGLSSPSFLWISASGKRFRDHWTKEKKSETFDTTIADFPNNEQKDVFDIWPRPFSWIIKNMNNGLLDKNEARQNSISPFMYADIVSSVYADGDCEKYRLWVKKWMWNLQQKECIFSLPLRDVCSSLHLI